ncbi:hypothetical protein JMG10_18490 [Nostoc ellipsosporum NOK]|nr:hypothetical protein [Nostoc ellipsosporum NOK]
MAKIEKLYRQSPVDRAAAVKLIGYSSLSGPASKALAAQASYGLVERAGKGEMRVTARARAILHPDNLDERRRNLIAAAFEPNLFQELRARWPDMIPPEDGIVTYLHRQGFNQTAIRPAMKAYRDTLLFLEQEGANDSIGNETLASSVPKEKIEEAFGDARVGDLVELEIDGSLATSAPVRVRAVSADHAWIFVEGSETGITMANATVVERPMIAADPVPAPTLPLVAPMPSSHDAALNETPTGYRSETFDADEGQIKITWPSNLSPQSVEDMKDWLELLKRRIARRAGESRESD